MLVASSLWIVRKIVIKLLVLILFIPIGGIGLILLTWMERVPKHDSGPEPQLISCEKLLAEGPGQNYYIALTDFRLDVNRRMSDSLLGPNAGEKVWVPVAASDKKTSRGPVQLLLETEQTGNPSDLEVLQRTGELVGMLQKGTSNVRLRDVFRLQHQYPQTDWSRCWLLEHREAPPRSWVTYGLMVLDVLMILAGVPIWWFAWCVWNTGKTYTDDK